MRKPSTFFGFGFRFLALLLMELLACHPLALTVLYEPVVDVLPVVDPLGQGLLVPFTTTGVLPRNEVRGTSGHAKTGMTLGRCVEQIAIADAHEVIATNIPANLVIETQNLACVDF